MLVYLLVTKNNFIMKNRHFLLLLVFIVFNSCKKDENIETKMSTKNNLWEIKNKDAQSVIVEWEQYQNDSVKIKTPIGWRVKKSKDTGIFFPYDKNHPKLYFAISKYNVAEVNF
jgi:hypothetical protein